MGMGHQEALAWPGVHRSWLGILCLLIDTYFLWIRLVGGPRLHAGTMADVDT